MSRPQHATTGEVVVPKSAGRGASLPARMRVRLRNRRGAIAIAAIAIAAIAAAAVWFWSGSSQASEYTTSKVERGDIRSTVTATGTLQAVTTVDVGSQASGTISELHADFNSIVKKGQVVAQLDPTTFQAQVAQAKANLEQARAGLAQAQAGVTQSVAGAADARAKVAAARSTAQGQRAGTSSAEANVAVLKAQRDDAASQLKAQESLLESGVIARRDYETADAAYKAAQARYQQAEAQLAEARVAEESAAGAGQAQAAAQSQQSVAGVAQSRAQVLSAQAQVQQAEAALELAEANLAHTTITSPIDGVVVSRDVDVGQTVAASLQAPTLFTIANDLTHMQVIANIDQADIGSIDQAKDAEFTVDAFPGEEFKGSIEQLRLKPQTIENVVTYSVVLDVANPDQKLKPGMTADLTITTAVRPNVLKVANAALRYEPSRDQGSGRGTTRQPSADEQAVPATAPVLEGQTRRVYVLVGGKPEPRLITVGLTDGTSTEVTGGDLREGEVLVTGENTARSSSPRTNQPGTFGAPGSPGRR